MRRFRFLLAAVLAVASMTVGACSCGDDDDGGQGGGGGGGSAGGGGGGDPDDSFAGFLRDLIENQTREDNYPVAIEELEGLVDDESAVYEESFFE